MKRLKNLPFFMVGVSILHLVSVWTASAATQTEEIQIIRHVEDPRLDQVRSAKQIHSRWQELTQERFDNTKSPNVFLLEQEGGIGEVDRETPPTETNMRKSWEPYSGDLSWSHAAHLANRTLIGARFEEIESAVGLGAQAAVQMRLASQPAIPAPGPWATEPVPSWNSLTDAEQDSLVDAYAERGEILRMWWVEQLVNNQVGITETMVHFWHDHFANELGEVFFPQAMYLQNQQFRDNATGNFRDLVRNVAKSPAMLIYLDGWSNTRWDPNENFSRELMELFTMGEGNYNQVDVVEAAKACTGWSTDGRDVFFTPDHFDPGQKTILGQTGNWDMDDLIDIIFEQEATAEFLARKLFRWFIDDTPQEYQVSSLAELIRVHDYEMAPILEAMLSSEIFMHVHQYKGSIIRDGVDIYAGQLRRFHTVGYTPTVDMMAFQTEWTHWQMWDYGHMLLDPPSVAGWPGHRNWINTYTLPVRKDFSVSILTGGWGEEQSLGFALDVIGESMRFTNPNDPNQLIDDLALLCLGHKPTDLIRESMVEELLQGAAPYDWSIYLPDAEQRLVDLYRYVMRLPDYQLK
ncbi:MAG: DUF1800 domain-containing protein [Candidatus Eisenbacteria bacterium]|uniref:DUF1800 domain-containing protein n=1 Tax=Eiseniibacteriota bacterium TaxID=2212470 RepID=A0A7Y2EAM2_UNCEI|nr:DUF1800 domain-containing protein [Candidatus Eisenbacteria bacterium]